MNCSGQSCELLRVWFLKQNVILKVINRFPIHTIVMISDSVSVTEFILTGRESRPNMIY